MRCCTADQCRWRRRMTASEEPEVLRRVDGSSVYTVAGADLYTSQRILDAEQRLIATAGRRDGTVGRRVGGGSGAARDGRQRHRAGCRPGRAGPVRCAPPGPGCSWRSRRPGPGRPPPCAPSPRPGPRTAARSSAWPRPPPPPPSSREQTGIHADTLAKLTWSLQHGELPDWAARIGPRTLVIIDEAGMADTLTLDRVVHFVTALGGSVRLIGDDQQLGAIGAGGILRDIKHTHGALQLTELHRFTHPAEAAASLALRDGDPAALDFYLNHGRVHVGDLATTTQDAFTAWAADRAAGLDAIMLAPTRELVADLNHRARTHRLGRHASQAVKSSWPTGTRPASGT